MQVSLKLHNNDVPYEPTCCTQCKHTFIRHSINKNKILLIEVTLECMVGYIIGTYL